MFRKVPQYCCVLLYLSGTDAKFRSAFVSHWGKPYYFSTIECVSIATLQQCSTVRSTYFDSGREIPMSQNRNTLVALYKYESNIYIKILLITIPFNIILYTFMAPIIIQIFWKLFYTDSTNFMPRSAICTSAQDSLASLASVAIVE